MFEFNSIDAIKCTDAWRDTSLGAFANNLYSKGGMLGIFGDGTNLSFPCFIRYGVCARIKDIKEINKTFLIADHDINAEFKQHIYIQDYNWFNSFLLKSSVIYDSEAFSKKAFKSQYISSVSCANIYIQTDDSYVYMTFFNKDLSQLFTFYIDKISAFAKTFYEYEDKDLKNIEIYETCECADRYVFDDKLKAFVYEPAFRKTKLKEIITEEDEVRKEKIDSRELYNGGLTKNRRIKVINSKYYFLRYIPDKENRQKYDKLEDDFFFENLQKVFKAKNIQKMQEISNTDFWDLASILGLTDYISSNSGINRVLKYKIIIINRLLGYDRFNEEKFSLKQLHFNKVKSDYYFTNKLNLSKILEFNFITEDERKYLKDMKDSLSGGITMVWKKKEVDLLFDKDNAIVHFGSIAEAVALIGNKTENQIKDKFKTLYNTMIRKRYIYHPYLCDHLIIKTRDRLELILNKKMEDYRKSMAI